jgi:hypothetical protein
MESIEELKRKLAEYEKRMGIGESDPAKEGYLVLVNILNQQNAYLKNFKISSFIASEEKADQLAYKNSKELWEKLSDMIEDINRLKIILKMEGEEKKNSFKPISATSLDDEEE